MRTTFAITASIAAILTLAACAPTPDNDVQACVDATSTAEQMYNTASTGDGSTPESLAAVVSSVRGHVSDLKSINGTSEFTPLADDLADAWDSVADGLEASGNGEGLDALDEANDSVLDAARALGTYCDQQLE